MKQINITDFIRIVNNIEQSSDTHIWTLLQCDDISKYDMPYNGPQTELEEQRRLNRRPIILKK